MLCFYFMAMTMDNASTNNEIFRNVSKYLLSLYDINEHPDRHMRCIAHVINLVAQAILSGLKEVESCDDVDETSNDDSTDTYLKHKSDPIHYDVSKDPDQIEMEAQRDSDLTAPLVDDEFDRILGIDFDEVQEEISKLGLTSALKKVSILNLKQYAGDVLMRMLDPFYCDKARFISSEKTEILEHFTRAVWR